MTTRYEIGQAHHALDKNQLHRLFAGTGHVSGGPIQLVADNDIEAPTPWTVFYDGVEVSVDSANNRITMPAPDEQWPRWDVVYIDEATGTLEILQGTPAELEGEAGLRARNPAPPDIRSLAGVVIGAVYRRPSEASINSSYVYDRRFNSDYALHDLYVKVLTAENLTVQQDATIQGNADVTGQITVTGEGVFQSGATVADAPVNPTDVVRELERSALEAILLNHDARHENNGADEINVTGLSGDLADAQDPKAHANKHHAGAVDELDAAELSGALGATGQFLSTNGTDADWVEAPTGINATDAYQMSMLSSYMGF